jgi:hypothetical protein
MVRALIIGLMADLILVSGERVESMDSEYTHGLMGEGIRDIMLMMKNTVKVRLAGLMESNIKVDL